MVMWALFQVMHTIRDTPKNPAGLCALSVDNDGGYLAYPGNSQVCNYIYSHSDCSQTFVSEKCAILWSPNSIEISVFF